MHVSTVNMLAAAVSDVTQTVMGAGRSSGPRATQNVVGRTTIIYLLIH